MKNLRSIVRVHICIALILCLAWAFNAVSPGPDTAEASVTRETPSVPESAALDEKNPRVKKVKDTQERHTRDLMAMPDVVGTAVGLNEENVPAVVVFTIKQLQKGALPDFLDGVPVATEVTGEIFALARGGAKGAVNPTSRFAMPVPIGVSTGNSGECSSGTIGARVKDVSANLFALSNNHVYALVNTASANSAVLQPGLYDTNCSSAASNSIGALYSFVAIDFSGGNNTVDAAIAQTSAAQVGSATPADGYGKPNSQTYTAATGNSVGVGQSVKKYGRTTGLTTGTVKGINATIRVCYDASCSLVGTFVNQISIKSGSFSKSGDSGALIVTNDSNAYPIGLLFAGGSGHTFANPIDAVLSILNVSIDGK